MGGQGKKHRGTDPDENGAGISRKR